MLSRHTDWLPKTNSKYLSKARNNAARIRMNISFGGSSAGSAATSQLFIWTVFERVMGGLC
jgi:hypothetical protein